jgi:hypothetical protein
MFRTKFVEKIKTHILSSVTFIRKSCCLWDNVEKYARTRQSTDDNVIRRMRSGCFITKATNTHSEYIILNVFPRQQWLGERDPVLDVYVHCLSCLCIWYPKKKIGFLWSQIHLLLRSSVRIASYFTVVHLVHHSTTENVTQVSCNALLKYIMVLSSDGVPGLRILNSDWATGWNFRSSSPAIWKRFFLLQNVQTGSTPNEPLIQ